MLRRTLALALGAALGAAMPAAVAEDLVQIYHDAVGNDPTLASARATWVATQENVPQARANLLPSVTLAANATETDFFERLHTDPSLTFVQRFPQYQYTVTASQPLYRKQNVVALDQARQTIGQSDYILSSA